MQDILTQSIMTVGSTIMNAGAQLTKSHLKLSSQKIVKSGFWTFWKSQLPSLLIAAEAEAGRLLPKPVEEGAKWKQVREERPHSLKPDPRCSQGELLSDKKKD